MADEEQERKPLLTKDPFRSPNVTRRENFDAEEDQSYQEREAARVAQREEHARRVFKREKQDD